MKSMLVIESCEIVAGLFTEIFKKQGWAVDTCGDRDGAISLLTRSNPYDAILLSYRVPGTDGVQLIRLIRTLEPRRMIAVVMVTGTGGISEEALAAGANEVLLKPIEPARLVSVVDKHLL